MTHTNGYTTDDTIDDIVDNSDMKINKTKYYRNMIPDEVSSKS